MRVTKARLRGTIERIQKYYPDISIRWVYGQPRVFNADGSRELSPRLPTGRMDNWLHGFEAGSEAAYYARNEEVADMLKGLVRFLEAGLDTCIVEGWEVEEAIVNRIIAVKRIIGLGGGYSGNKTIRIEIHGGALIDVDNLPPGWDYELCDWDNCSACGTLDPDCEWCAAERGEA